MSGKNVKKVSLVPIIELDIETQMKARDIRNEEEVRKWMYTDHVIGTNEHLGWIDSLRTDKRQLVFMVLDELDNPLGTVYANFIDLSHKKADWSYWLTKDAHGGLGSVIEYKFINFVFDILGLEKLNCEVIEGNDAVVKLHKKFLFEEEGFRRSNILKDGKRIGVHFLGLTKQDWEEGKDELSNKYEKIFSKFSVTIECKNEPEPEKNPVNTTAASDSNFHTSTKSTSKIPNLTL